MEIDTGCGCIIPPSGFWGKGGTATAQYAAGVLRRLGGIAKVVGSNGCIDGLLDDVGKIIGRIGIGVGKLEGTIRLEGQFGVIWES